MTVEEIERELRVEWWMNHGHDFHALYGDDGEMQCAVCGSETGIYDYKRMPMETLRKLVHAMRVQRVKDALRDAPAVVAVGQRC